MDLDKTEERHDEKMNVNDDVDRKPRKRQTRLSRSRSTVEGFRALIQGSGSNNGKEIHEGV
jgi:hypothetical protein